MEKETSLSKFLANAGIAARRKVVDLIKNGEITINHHVVTEPGYKLQKNDTVRYQKKEIKPTAKVYILLNKPKNYITTAQDEYDRETVLDLIPLAQKKRLFPIGRLDRDTTGLILITNDGELAQNIAHPKYNTPKTYRVTLSQPITTHALDKLHFGIRLRDGIIKPDRLYAVPGSRNTQIIIEIHSGKNRIIRRIFEALGYEVILLDRFKYAGLTKKNLSLGNWRYLTPKEISTLTKN
jgi:23S rRNA pseudouridine2605 synthase